MMMSSLGFGEHPQPVPTASRELHDSVMQRLPGLTLPHVTAGPSARRLPSDVRRVRFTELDVATPVAAAAADVPLGASSSKPTTPALVFFSTS